MEALRADELVDARQGFGWFVRSEPVRQPLARLGTIEDQLEGSGASPSDASSTSRSSPPPAGCGPCSGSSGCCRSIRLNLADGQPFARVTVWCPEALGAELSWSQVERSSFYELLQVDVGGAVQTIGADAASAADARLLEVPAGSPVLVCERVTSDAGGRPVLLGEYVFPGHRTEFIVDLPHAEASIAPSGLRLVE